MFNNVYQGKRVFVTGHTGFKGSWLCEWLIGLGAEVTGFSLPLAKNQKLFEQLELEKRILSSVEGDIRDHSALQNAISEARPDFVFHLAAQPLVRLSYREPILTFKTNFDGTLNLLEALRTKSEPCIAVIVTTDKCYENREWLNSYREEDALGGRDPYSASKACSEIVTHSYRRTFFDSESPVNVASARAGNVIGGGDWAEDRIVPDIVRAIRKTEPVVVRNCQATRPWQHVLEPLSGYLWLGAKMSTSRQNNFATYDCFNFGPSLDSNQAVIELVRRMICVMGGTWRDDSPKDQPHEASRLNLSIDKAFHVLGWSPLWDFDESIRETAEWYQVDLAGGDVLHKTKEQISNYCRAAVKRDLAWAKSE